MKCCLSDTREQCADCVWHPNATMELKDAGFRRAATIRSKKGKPVAMQFRTFRSKSGWKPTDGRKPVHRHWGV